MQSATKNPTLVQNELIAQFAKLSAWEDKYKLIIERGKHLPSLPEQYRTEDNKVKGCQSQVWLFAELNPDQTITYHADSDALIVKGLVSMLVEIYSGASVKDILSTDAFFLKEIGLNAHLSPSRTNGLFAMIKQMKLYALAYSARI